MIPTKESNSPVQRLSQQRLSQQRLPELLCPAGSSLALEAAIEGGADAVYLGGAGFNARMNASNFSDEALRDGIRLAHTYGVKVYLTLNTLVLDREISAYLHAAQTAQEAGADALIVADIGGAAAIHRTFPELSLHASTQMSAHNAAAGEALRALGFCRMVVARELSLENLRTAAATSPIEIEAFIHGALCVCHSGQCLFSSIVGGRSGNRGECAQPCRLPYHGAVPREEREERGRTDYPLSLKDLCLARHVPALIDSGIASLKIEGRMKSPEYVLAVTRIWRRLLDERRAADSDEMFHLAEAFSRGGFTDGYFTSRIDHRMLGIRSEHNKKSGQNLPRFDGLNRRLPLELHVSLQKNRPAALTVRSGNRCFTATGAVPEAALSAPLTKSTVERQMLRLGNTPFEATSCTVTLDEPLMLPISALNALRRDAIAGLTEQIGHQPTRPSLPYQPATAPTERSANAALRQTARFTSVEQLTPTARSNFDRCYLPLHCLRAPDEQYLSELIGEAELGVELPPVIPDTEMPAVFADMLELARAGVRYALVGNLGHLAMVRACGMQAVGDFRLNVTNSESVAYLSALGVQSPLLSPELTLPQIRDIHGEISTIVYGRIPLMILEKCVIREIADCRTCSSDEALLIDRLGVGFPVRRLPEHRNILYNSVPTYMADRRKILQNARVGEWHFIFSDESPAQVDSIILAYHRGVPPVGAVRRLSR